MTRSDQHGFTLLEMVCVIALIAMLAAVLMPALARHTSRAQLQAYALEAATLLKMDRDIAIRRHGDVATLVDAPARAIRSGATAQALRIPDDVRFDALLPQTCGRQAALSSINFFANGTSCGGAITLTRFDMGYEIRVNWLTGRIEVAPRDTSAN